MTRKNRYIKKITIMVLICAMLFNFLAKPQQINAAGDYSEILYSLNADEVDDTSIDLYNYENTLYISIADLCSLTRCRWSEEDGIITVTQGIMNVEFDVEAQTVADGFQSTDITILEIASGQYAVPALMFLSYFKATAFMDNDTLYCRMPSCTAWEALDVDYANTLVDIYDLYGGETGVENSMKLDLIMEWIMGNLSTSDGYVNDAFVDALAVNLYDYKSVKQYVADIQGKLSNDLQSDDGMEMINVLQDTVTLSQEPAEWYIQYYYGMLERSYVKMAYNVYQKGYVEEVQHYGEAFYDAFTEKNQVSEATEKYFSDTNYLMVFISSLAETAQQTKYIEATDNLAYHVMGKDNIAYLGMDVGDNAWFQIANQFQNVLGTGAANLKDTVISYVTSNVFWDNSLEIIAALPSASTGISEGLWGFALDAARIFTENFPLTKTLVEAFRADLIGIYQSELQQNVSAVLYHILQKINEEPENSELYEKLIQANELYCRVSIAMYENLSTSVDQFSNDPERWQDLFQEKIDDLAISLYQLTNIQDDNIQECFPMDIESFKEQAISEDAQQAGEQQQNGINAESLFRDFISSRAYEEYTSGWSCEPDGYAFVDINQDGIVELIIKGSYGDDFSAAAVFKISADGQSIINIEQFDYCYNLQYSQEYKALVYSDTRPSAEESVDNFYSIQDDSLVLSFAVCWGLGYGIEYDDPAITQYTDGLTNVEFNSLLDFIDNTGEAEGKIELSGYLNDFQAIDGLLQGDDPFGQGIYEIYHVTDNYNIQYACRKGSQKVDFMIIEGNETYQLFGIYVGQDVSIAKNTLTANGWELSENLSKTSKYFSNGSYITLEWDNNSNLITKIMYETLETIAIQ